MNIIPFVTIFVISILLIISSIFKGDVNYSFSQIGLNGYVKANRIMRNNVEEKKFSHYIKKNKKDGNKKNKKKKSLIKIESNFREKMKDDSKFNLFPLFYQDQPETIVNQFKKIMKSIYLDTELCRDIKFPELFLESLAKEILEKGKNLPTNKSLELEHVILSEKFQKTWYKMLHGCSTHNWQINQKKNNSGWPPFSQFFILSEQNSKFSVLCVKKAHPIILKEFFGEAITKEIIEYEHNTSSPIKKKDLEEILLQHNFPSDKKKYFQYIPFKKMQHIERVVEKNSHISIEIPLK